MNTIGRFILVLTILFGLGLAKLKAQDDVVGLNENLGPALGMVSAADFPGIAGSSGKYRIVSRGAFGATLNASGNISLVDVRFDAPVPVFNLGFGLEMAARRGFGYTSSRHTGAMANYRFPFVSKEHELRVGGTFGLWSRSTNDRMFGYDMIDVSTGLYYRYRRVFAAYTLQHMNQEWIRSFPYFFTQPLTHRFVFGASGIVADQFALRAVGEGMIAGASNSFRGALAVEIPGGIVAELNGGTMSYTLEGNFATAMILDPQDGFALGMKGGYYPRQEVGFIATLERYKTTLPNPYVYYVVGMIFIASI